MGRLLLLVLGALAVGGLGLLRKRRRERESAPPKLEPVSSDWLAQARGRHEHTP